MSNSCSVNTCNIKLRPLGDRLVVKRLEERTTKSGIVIPDSVVGEKPSRGTVVAIGPGKVLENGNVQKLNVKVGDQVLFGKYAGTEVKVDDSDLIVMREDDVMGIIEN